MKIKVIIILLLNIVFYDLQAYEHLICKNYLKNSALKIELTTQEVCEDFVQETIKSWLAQEILKEYNIIIQNDNIIEYLDCSNIREHYPLVWEIFEFITGLTKINEQAYDMLSDYGVYTPNEKLCKTILSNFLHLHISRILITQMVTYSNDITSAGNFFKRFPDIVYYLAISEQNQCRSCFYDIFFKYHNIAEIQNLAKSHVKQILENVLNKADLVRMHNVSLELLEADIKKQLNIIKEYEKKYLSEE